MRPQTSGSSLRGKDIYARKTRIQGTSPRPLHVAIVDETRLPRWPRSGMQPRFVTRYAERNRMPDDDARKHAGMISARSFRLLVAATTGVTDVVEAMHKLSGAGRRCSRRLLAWPVDLITRVAYGSVRGVTRLVGVTLDVALEKLAPFLGESTPGPERRAMVAALPTACSAIGSRR